MVRCERNGEALHEVKGSAFREAHRSGTTVGARLARARSALCERDSSGTTVGAKPRR